MADTRVDELRRRLERDPGSRLFAQLAEELRKNGELEEAIRVARAGLAVHTAYPSARLTLGRALLDSGDPASARGELETALREAPDNILASRYLAQAREAAGDLKGAADQYRKTLLMAPGDRQLQGALAAVEAQLAAPGGGSGTLAAETTPPAPRRAPPPLPAATGQQPPRVGVPPVVSAPARPMPPAQPEPELRGDEPLAGGLLPPTLRIRTPLTAIPPPPPPPPPPASPAAPSQTAVASYEPTTLPGSSAGAAARGAAVAEAKVAAAADATVSASGPVAPFSSSTLAELYFQQGLVDRAVDVYRQLVQQEPDNAKARVRLAELEAAAPAPQDRAARRRALERTIAGLETLLGAVRRR